MLRFVTLTVCLIIFYVSAPGQNLADRQTSPSPPHTPQEILLLFSGDTADERIVLTLNNNRADVLPTSLTVYTAKGVATQLKTISLIPQESRMLELSPLLQDAGLNHQELGWVKLNYSGVIMELGAQLTLYPNVGGPGADSSRSLSADFVSGERDAAFWVPQGGRVHLAFANVSAESINVQARCGRGSEQLNISPGTAQTLEIDPRELGPAFQGGDLTMSCELNSSGAVDALRAVGTVSASGYTAPVRFYDPKAATFPSLTAVGLESPSKTHVSVHNTSEQVVDFTPVIREASLTDPQSETLSPLRLAPHQSTAVEIGPSLANFRDKNIGIVTLTLKSTAKAGSLVGAVTQITPQTQLVEDIPLRTSAPPAYARGSYPLRWEGDYTNMVTVTNTAEETLRLGGVITAGEMSYVLTRTDIKPGATMVLDVDKWRREGIPDINGKVLPKDASYGKIHWIEMAGGTKAGLLGRTSLTSIVNRQKSSFSCNNPCQYNSQTEPNFYAGIYLTLAPNTYKVNNVTEYVSQVNGSSYSYPINYDSNNVSTTNSGVAAAGPDTTATNIRVNGNVTGSVTLSYDQFITQYQPNYPAMSCAVVNRTQHMTGTTNVSACPVPVGDKSSYVKQTSVDNSAPTSSDFVQTLTTPGNDDGIYVMEAENDTGSDTCYSSSIPNNPYPPVTSVSPAGSDPSYHTWLVGGITPNSAESQTVVPSHNQWGADEIGYLPAPTRFYQQQRPKFGLGLPCGFKLYQQMSFSCKPGAYPYEVYQTGKVLTSTIDSTGITNCRDLGGSGQSCSPHYAYQ